MTNPNTGKSSVDKLKRIKLGSGEPEEEQFHHFLAKQVWKEFKGERGRAPGKNFAAFLMEIRGRERVVSSFNVNEFAGETPDRDESDYVKIHSEEVILGALRANKVQFTLKALFTDREPCTNEDTDRGREGCAQIVGRAVGGGPLPVFYLSEYRKRTTLDPKAIADWWKNGPRRRSASPEKGSPTRRRLSPLRLFDRPDKTEKGAKDEKGEASARRGSASSSEGVDKKGKGKAAKDGSPRGRSRSR